MDRVAVFVDAGYLFAQGSVLVAGTKLRRSETVLDEGAVVAFLKHLATTLTSLPLLRIYWYDGTDSGPTAVHTSLAFQPDLKIRLGIVNSYGEQKGVDSLIVSDLIDLSRNRAMCDAVLLTGDEDIRVGVQKAQDAGVRVHLVGLHPAQHNQSNLLRQEADTLHELSQAEIATFLRRSPPPPQPLVVEPAVLPLGADPIEAIARQLCAALGPLERARVAGFGRGVPADIDRQLLKLAAASVPDPLTDTLKHRLRDLFVAACKAAQ